MNFLQICAVLAAVTEVIRAQGGTESETEYFGALVSVKMESETSRYYLMVTGHSSMQTRPCRLY